LGVCGGVAEFANLASLILKNAGGGFQPDRIDIATGHAESGFDIVDDGFRDFHELAELWIWWEWTGAVAEDGRQRDDDRRDDDRWKWRAGRAGLANRGNRLSGGRVDRCEERTAAIERGDGDIERIGIRSEWLAGNEAEGRACEIGDDGDFLHISYGRWEMRD